MDHNVRAQTLVTIAFILVACGILAVTNQVEAEENAPKSNSTTILAHPDDKIGVPLEEKKLEEAEQQAKTTGNILTDKGMAPKVLGPPHNEEWPQKLPEEKKKS